MAPWRGKTRTRLPPLVHDVAERKRQESWFALITTLRNAGLGVGALGASLAVAIGGTNGYTAIVAVNAVSFAVAAVLTRLGSPGGNHAVTRRRVNRPGRTEPDGSRAAPPAPAPRPMTRRD